MILSGEIPDRADLYENCELCGEQLPYGSEEPHPHCLELLPVCDECGLAILPGDDHDGDNGIKVHSACCIPCKRGET